MVKARVWPQYFYQYGHNGPLQHNPIATPFVVSYRDMAHPDELLYHPAVKEPKWLAELIWGIGWFWILWWAITEPAEIFVRPPFAHPLTKSSR